MKLLVCDVGGTEIKYGTIDESLNISDHGSTPTPHDCFESFLAAIKGIYDKIGQDCEGLAMALPGFIDTRTGLVLGGCPTLAYDHGKHVGTELENLLGCRVHVENDAKAAIIAEHECGSLAGCPNCGAIILGTGTGGGLVINNQVLRGIHGTAGEISFLNLNAWDWSNPLTSVDKNCSTSGLLRMVKESTGMELDGRQFFERLSSVPQLQSILREFCRLIDVLIYNLGMTMDLEKVAVGGGISRQPLLFETLESEKLKLQESSGFESGTKPYFPEIVPCKFFNEANMIGAYYSYINSLVE